MNTPGPWYGKVTSSDQGLIIAETGENVAVCYYPRDTQLIAAAPELLEVLQELFYGAGASITFHDKDLSCKIAAVIYKTKGD